MEEPSREASSAKRVSPLAIGVIILVVITAAVLKVKDVFSEKLPTPAATTDVRKTPSTTQELIEAVSRHLSINTSEQPTVATVQDVETLKKQNPSFYQEAQNGDRVLVWSDKVVLYSTSRDVILAVIPLNPAVATTTDATMTTSTPAVATSTAVIPPDEAREGYMESPTIEVRNGSGTPGLGKTAATKLKDDGLDVTVVTAAQGKTYPTSVIYIPNGKSFPGTVSIIARQLNAQVVDSLPKEINLKGEVILVVGADAKF